MKKISFLSLLFVALLALSCDKDEPNLMGKSDNLSSSEMNYEPLYPGEEFVALITAKSPFGFYGDGPGTIDPLNGQQGGNCVNDNGVCFIKGLPKIPGSLTIHSYYYEKPLLDEDLPPRYPLDSLRQDFIDKNPIINDGLTNNEAIEFRNSLKFNYRMQLVSWDNILLRKATGQHFNDIVTNIIYILNGEPIRIVLVDSETNREELLN